MDIKKTIKKTVLSLLRFPAIWWSIQKSMGAVSKIYETLRNLHDHSDPLPDSSAEKKCRDLASKLVVMNGPFKGMKYPGLNSICSAVYPKLLGSYELELLSTIETILRRDYDCIVDIGCAEGYYAVGIGRHMQNARVYVFDTCKEALQLCCEMAELNGVRIVAGGHCSKETIMKLDLGRKAIIVSDCEGYEVELFDEELALTLGAHDVLIESHDFLDINSTKKLLDVFSRTHDCIVVESVDDIVKAYSYEFVELTDFNLSEKHQMLAEYRPTIMRWIFAKSKESR